MSGGLSHFDAKGDAQMVDVSQKAVTARVAVAEGFVEMSAQTLAIITEGRAKKGDVAGVARLAGIMAAKKTADLIPLCHPLPLSKVALEIAPAADRTGLRVEATVKTTGQTGVEMEALTAVSLACLTIYDMVKAVEKAMVIADIRLIFKDGGASGRYGAPSEAPSEAPK
ncbi:MAG: cyclic pyranopterin monophosphate synthase MoaC [Pseudomonadota bacterium]